MPRQDRIEIKHKGRTFTGAGDLRTSVATLQHRGGVNQDGSAYRTSRPVAPWIEGYAVFDGRVTSAELMAVTNADVLCTRADGNVLALCGAVMLKATDGRDPSGYTIRIMGQLAP